MPPRSRTIASNHTIVNVPDDDDDGVDAILLQTTDAVSCVCILTQCGPDSLLNNINDYAEFCNISLRDHPRVNLNFCPIGKSHSVAVVLLTQRLNHTCGC